MLGLVLLAAYPVVLAALLGLGLRGKLPPTFTASSLVGVGTMITLVPVLAFARDITLPPLCMRLGLAFGVAAFVGGLVAARTLHR